MVGLGVVPHRTAVVNVDMQNCLVQGSPFAVPDGLAVQEPNQPGSTAAVCRPVGILVVHTRQVLRPDGSNTSGAPITTPLPSGSSAGPPPH
jgi:ureidoacrylate peracid hydrolase